MCKFNGSVRMVGISNNNNLHNVILTNSYTYPQKETPNNVSLNNPSFGRENTTIPTEKTHAGLIAGTIVGIITGGMRHVISRFHGFKDPIAVASLYLLSSIGAGALVDSLINKRREKFAQENSQKSPKEILISERRADTSRMGGIYYKSNVGRRFGTLIGSIVFPIIGIIKGHLNPSYKSGLFLDIIVGGFKGFIMGSITDVAANKSASKFADRAIVSKHIANNPEDTLETY